MSPEQLANHILQIEYPGKTMSEALTEAGNRMIDARTRGLEIEKEIMHLNHEMDEIKQRLRETSEAYLLFSKILNEES